MITYFFATLTIIAFSGIQFYKYLSRNISFLAMTYFKTSLLPDYTFKSSKRAKNDINFYKNSSYHSIKSFTKNDQHQKTTLSFTHPKIILTKSIFKKHLITSFIFIQLIIYNKNLFQHKLLYPICFVFQIKSIQVKTNFFVCVKAVSIHTQDVQENVNWNAVYLYKKVKLK